jgi:hypothetical protein
MLALLLRFAGGMPIGSERSPCCEKAPCYEPLVAAGDGRTVTVDGPAGRLLRTVRPLGGWVAREVGDDGAGDLAQVGGVGQQPGQVA